MKVLLSMVWALTLGFGAHRVEAAEPQSLRARLQGELAPEDVALLCGKGGLRAVVGPRVVSLGGGDVQWCVVDHLGDVIWFGARGTLYGLDLAGDGKRVVVATGILDRIAIAWRRPQVQTLGGDWSNETHWMVLGVDEKELRVVEGKLAHTLKSGQLAADKTRGRVVGRIFLEKIRKRALAKATLPKPRSPCPEFIPGLGNPLAECDAGEVCGEARRWLPSTPYCAVLRRQSCSDRCYTNYALWHVKQEQFHTGNGLFAPYNPLKGQLEDEGQIEDPAQAIVSPSGKAFIAHGRIYSFEGRHLHPGFGGDLGGWLDLAPLSTLDPNSAQRVYAQGMEALQECTDGEHVRKRCAKVALGLIRSAAEEGLLEAQFKLGALLFRWRFQRQAPDPYSAWEKAGYMDALTWLARAANGGHEKALQYLPYELMETLRTGDGPRRFEPPFESLPPSWLVDAAKAAGENRPL